MARWPAYRVTRRKGARKGVRVKGVRKRVRRGIRKGVRRGVRKHVQRIYIYIYTRILGPPKTGHLQIPKLQKLQNINYAICINNKIQI